MVDEIPVDAHRSEDGHYWWDEPTSQWRAVPGGAADPSAAGNGGTTHDGTLQFEIGYVTTTTHEHHEIVAVLAQAGVELPAADGGQAYA